MYIVDQRDVPGNDHVLKCTMHVVGIVTEIKWLLCGMHVFYRKIMQEHTNKINHICLILVLESQFPTHI